MERPWQPSRNACLTLKQLGLSAAQIQASMVAFRHHTSEQTDLAFMRFARDNAGNDVVAERTAELLELPLHWQPADEITMQLQTLGYQPETIAHYRDLFVISIREQGRALRDPGKAFVAFCERRPTRLPAPIPPTWLPNTETLQCLIRERSLHVERLPDLIEYFIHTHQGRYSSDWDSTFVGWIEQRRVEGTLAC